MAFGSFSSEGWLAGARRLPSPHFDARPEGATIELLVIHNVSLPPGEFGAPDVIDLFLGRLDHSAHPYYERIRGLRVSPHFLIRRDGDLIQFVGCASRAWHAGVSEWRRRSRCNDFSIGIELEGADDVPFADAQYAALAHTARATKAAYPIVDMVGHSDISPGRKTDPGPCFDWVRFRKELALGG